MGDARRVVLLCLYIVILGVTDETLLKNSMYVMGVLKIMVEEMVIVWMDVLQVFQIRHLQEQVVPWA